MDKKFRKVIKTMGIILTTLLLIIGYFKYIMVYKINTIDENKNGEIHYIFKK